MPQKRSQVLPNSYTSNLAVDARPGAATSPDVLNVFQEGISAGAASKLRLGPFAGRPVGEAIGLSVQAWVRNLSYDKDVWVDLSLTDADNEVLHAETLTLGYREPAGAGGDFFAVGAAVPAPLPTSGQSASLRLQYRLYGQMNGQLFTDGMLHSHEIPVEGRPKAAAPKAAAPKAAAPKAAAPKAAAPKAAAPASVVPGAVAPTAPAPTAAAGRKAVSPKPATTTAAKQAGTRPADPGLRTAAVQVPQATDSSAAGLAAARVVSNDATAARVAEAGGAGAATALGTAATKPRSRKS